jgi:acetylornithine deacetylase/succinyl-diaminopimelate desuccinylase family protein
MEKDMKNLLAELDSAYTLKVLKEMISIPSVVGQEGALAEYLYGELEALGFECELHEVEPGRPNVYARLRGDGSGKRLNFNGHTDTIPVVDGWDTDPFTPIEKDGRVYGLGACDMKGGIACILNMLRAFVRSGIKFRGELSFSGVIDEEAYSKGAKAMLETDYGQVDAIVLAEPYPGDETKPIPLGLTGKVLYDVHVKGRAAHGFRPHQGVNAVEEAAKILANLDQLDFTEHSDFGTGNTCTLMIEGGYQVYSVVVPAYCRFEVNRLLVPGETVESAIRDMQRLAALLELKADVEVKTKPPRYEPCVLSTSDPIIQIFDQVYRDVMGVAPSYEYAYGITDANVFAGEAGIPCLHLGPERGGVHQKNEHVPADWLPRISEMYATIAARYLDAGI